MQLFLQPAAEAQATSLLGTDDCKVVPVMHLSFKSGICSTWHRRPNDGLRQTLVSQTQAP